MRLFRRRRRDAVRNRYRSTIGAGFERLENRLLLSADFRAIDGYENNPAHPDWGAAETQLLRIAPADYGDGVSTPAGADRASAREISNAVAAQTESIPNDRLLTDFVWQWGQFLDHDLDLTEAADPNESLPITVPVGDPYFDPFQTGQQTIDLSRSVYDPATGDSPGNPRQQINQITAYIDASNVYGSDPVRAAALRTFSGGKLKTSADDLLPFNVDHLPNAGGTSETLFLAGDVRANEQAALTAMHTLFVREHNRLADQIAGEHPSFDDEAIYQRARRLVAAEMQAITYNEFLPVLLGPDALGLYGGYNSEVNPGIANVFSTASYRFGHSMLSSELLRLDDAGRVIDAGNLALRDAFFAPEELVENGIDSLLRGLAAQDAQEIDPRVVDDVRNFLFGPPGAGGFDLASLNLQRGRDHGLPDYNQARIDYGLAPVESFVEITSDPELQRALRDVYGDVNSIDAWVGGLAEDHQPGASVGELVYTVLVDQFQRLRTGDRFWYQRDLTAQERAEINRTTLADIIRRNTEITNLQENVFYNTAVSYYTAQPSRRPSHMVLTSRGSEILLIDSHRRTTLLQTPIAETEKVVVMSDDRGRNRMTVDLSRWDTEAVGSVAVHGGTGRRDQLVVVATDQSDRIEVSGRFVTVNDVVVEYTGFESLVVRAGQGDDVLSILESTAARVTLDGGAGNDALSGNAGDDQLIGGPGHDDLFGSVGNDHLLGGAGRDTLAGGPGNDHLFGGSGNDRLFGDDGNDLLVGGRGRDDLDGGDGHDRLVEKPRKDRWHLSHFLAILPDWNRIQLLRDTLTHWFRRR